MERNHQVVTSQLQRDFAPNHRFDDQSILREKKRKNPFSSVAYSLPIVAGASALLSYKEAHAQQCRVATSGGLCECPQPNMDPHQDPVWIVSPGRCNEQTNPPAAAPPQPAPSQGFTQNEQGNGVGISVCQDRQDAQACICLTTQGTTVNIPLNGPGCVPGAVDPVYGTLPSIYYKSQQSAPVQYNSSVQVPQAVEQPQVQAVATTPPVYNSQGSKTITQEKIDTCCSLEPINMLTSWNCPAPVEICSETGRQQFGWTIVEASSNTGSQQQTLVTGSKAAEVRATPTSTPPPAPDVSYGQVDAFMNTIGPSAAAILAVGLGFAWWKGRKKKAH